MRMWLEFFLGLSIKSNVCEIDIWASLLILDLGTLYLEFEATDFITVEIMFHRNFHSKWCMLNNYQDLSYRSKGYMDDFTVCTQITH